MGWFGDAVEGQREAVEAGIREAVEVERWRIAVATVTPADLVGPVILEFDRRTKAGQSASEAYESLYRDLASGAIS